MGNLLRDHNQEEGCEMVKTNVSKISEEQFHRLLYSSWDFQQSLSALTFLREDCDLCEKYSKGELRRFKCYENQAIISFCRPFSASRAAVRLSLRLIGVELNESEHELKERLIYIRNKVVAHSDSDEMHYKTITIDVGDDDDFQFPLVLYDEGLHLSEKDHEILDLLLRKLMHGIAKVSIAIFRNDPDQFNTYKLPKSLRRPGV